MHLSVACQKQEKNGLPLPYDINFRKGKTTNDVC
uniref:Uncharacterized protein n=1 Tax=Arundo donax TaxID=35708 RepID=A0A0A9DR39_ARUDO